MENPKMKSLFIRCSEEEHELAHALAKSESRSLNKQIIHMIQKESEKQNIKVKDDSVGYDANGSPIEEPKLGLTGLLQTKKQES